MRKWLYISIIVLIILCVPILAALEYLLFEGSKFPLEPGSSPKPLRPMALIFILPSLVFLSLSLLYLWYSKRKRENLLFENVVFDISVKNGE